MTAKTARKSAPEATPAPKTCNVPSNKHGRCRRAPEWRGLCAAHRATHRGLADPKEGTADA